MGADAPILPNTMNAAAPDRTHPRRIQCLKNFLAPPCLVEALMRRTLIFVTKNF
jgi:hypothetical protein